MHLFMFLKRLQAGLVITALVLLLSIGLAAKEKKEQAQPAQTTAGQAGGAYAGSQTCQGCHDKVYSQIEASSHVATLKDSKAAPGGHGCESCHGPGQAHVDGGGEKTKIFTFKGVTAGEANQRCLTCHQNSQEHGNFARGAHAKNGVSCTDCHSPHHAKTAKALLSQKQPELCYSCHAQQKAEFNKPFHHRVNEGLVTCGDCHNMHGGVNGRSVRSAKQQDQVCFKCHTDKQGPWVFEHGPVRTDGCSSCHTAHGSNNVRLLKVHAVSSLCLQCHTLSATNTSKESGKSIANPTPRVGNNHNLTSRYYECTLCHTGIHGSNASNLFFK